MGLTVTDPLSQLKLPPGFRFYPTDEELLVQYLCRKVAGHQFPLQIIGDIDLYKFDPWVLPSKAIFGEKEWYFFSPRDRKYPNGSRPNRVAGSGYWKATGTDKVITTEGKKVGIKKALVFYVGKAPKGTKTNWIMHEYRLADLQKKNGTSKLDDWVLCRIYKKNSSAQKAGANEVGGGTKEESYSHGSSSSSSTQFDDMMESLPEISDRSFTLPRMNSLNDKLNFQNTGSGNFDWAALTAYTTSMPDNVTGIQAPLITMPAQPNANNHQNYMFVPTMNSINKEEEVESGSGFAQRLDNSGCYINSNAYASGFTGTVDPFAIRYPVQTRYN